MSSVDKFFSGAGRERYPFVVLTNNVEKARQIQTWTSRRVIFHRIQFSFRAGFDASSAPNMWRAPELPDHLGWSINYRHMLRYAAWDLFQEPVFDQFDFLMKVDGDLIFTADFDGERDPFLDLSAENYTHFAFWRQYKDLPFIAPNFGSAINDFILQEGIVPRTPSIIFGDDGSYLNTNFYGCFWAARIAFFRTQTYRRLYDHFDKRDGWYLHRWDEQKLYSVAAAFYWEPQNILYMSYAHVYHQENGDPMKCCGL